MVVDDEPKSDSLLVPTSPKQPPLQQPTEETALEGDSQKDADHHHALERTAATTPLKATAPVAAAAQEEQEEEEEGREPPEQDNVIDEDEESTCSSFTREQPNDDFLTDAAAGADQKPDTKQEEVVVVVASEESLSATERVVESTPFGESHQQQDPKEDTDATQSPEEKSGSSGDLGDGEDEKVEDLSSEENDENEMVEPPNESSATPTKPSVDASSTTRTEQQQDTLVAASSNREAPDEEEEEEPTGLTFVHSTSNDPVLDLVAESEAAERDEGATASATATTNSAEPNASAEPNVGLAEESGVTDKVDSIAVSLVEDEVEKASSEEKTNELEEKEEPIAPLVEQADPSSEPVKDTLSLGPIEQQAAASNLDGSELQQDETGSPHEQEQPAPPSATEESVEQDVPCQDSAVPKEEESTQEQPEEPVEKIVGSMVDGSEETVSLQEEQQEPAEEVAVPEPNKDAAASLLEQEAVAEEAAPSLDLESKGSSLQEHQDPVEQDVIAPQEPTPTEQEPPAVEELAASLEAAPEEVVSLLEQGPVEQNDTASLLEQGTVEGSAPSLVGPPESKQTEEEQESGVASNLDAAPKEDASVQEPKEAEEHAASPDTEPKETEEPFHDEQEPAEQVASLDPTKEEGSVSEPLEESAPNPKEAQGSFQQQQKDKVLVQQQDPTEEVVAPMPAKTENFLDEPAQVVPSPKTAPKEDAAVQEQEPVEQAASVEQQDGESITFNVNTEPEEALVKSWGSPKEQESPPEVKQQEAATDVEAEATSQAPAETNNDGSSLDPDLQEQLVQGDEATVVVRESADTEPTVMSKDKEKEGDGTATQKADQNQVSTEKEPSDDVDVVNSDDGHVLIKNHFKEKLGGFLSTLTESERESFLSALHVSPEKGVTSIAHSGAETEHEVMLVDRGAFEHPSEVKHVPSIENQELTDAVAEVLAAASTKDQDQSTQRPHVDSMKTNQEGELLGDSFVMAASKDPAEESAVAMDWILCGGVAMFACFDPANSEYKPISENEFPFEQALGQMALPNPAPFLLEDARLSSASSDEKHATAAEDEAVSKAADRDNTDEPASLAGDKAVEPTEEELLNTSETNNPLHIVSSGGDVLVENGVDGKHTPLVEVNPSDADEQAPTEEKSLHMADLDVSRDKYADVNNLIDQVKNGFVSPTIMAVKRLGQHSFLPFESVTTGDNSSAISSLSSPPQVHEPLTHSTKRNASQRGERQLLSRKHYLRAEIFNHIHSAAAVEVRKKNKAQMLEVFHEDPMKQEAIRLKNACMAELQGFADEMLGDLDADEESVHDEWQPDQEGQENQRWVISSVVSAQKGESILADEMRLLNAWMSLAEESDGMEQDTKKDGSAPEQAPSPTPKQPLQSTNMHRRSLWEQFLEAVGLDNSRHDAAALIQKQWRVVQQQRSASARTIQNAYRLRLKYMEECRVAAHSNNIAMARQRSLADWRRQAKQRQREKEASIVITRAIRCYAAKCVLLELGMYRRQDLAAQVIVRVMKKNRAMSFVKRLIELRLIRKRMAVRFIAKALAPAVIRFKRRFALNRKIALMRRKIEFVRNPSTASSAIAFAWARCRLNRRLLRRKRQKAACVITYAVARFYDQRFTERALAYIRQRSALRTIVKHMAAFHEQCIIDRRVAELEQEILLLEKQDWAAGVIARAMTVYHRNYSPTLNRAARVITRALVVFHKKCVLERINAAKVIIEAMELYHKKCVLDREIAEIERKIALIRQQNQAVVLISRTWRRHQAQVIYRQKLALLRQQQNQAARIIARAMAVYHEKCETERRVAQMLEELAMLRRRERASRIITREMRRYHEKCELDRKIAEIERKIALLRQQNESTVLIGSVWRRHRDQKRVAHLRRQIQAAVMIGSSWRRHQARQLLRQLQALYRLKQHCATRIIVKAMAAYHEKCEMDRRVAEVVQEMMLLRRKERAACLITEAMRRYHEKCELDRKIADVERKIAFLHRQNEAAGVIVRLFRCHRNRKMLDKKIHQRRRRSVRTIAKAMAAYHEKCEVDRRVAELEREILLLQEQAGQTTTTPTNDKPVEGGKERDVQVTTKQNEGLQSDEERAVEAAKTIARAWSHHHARACVERRIQSRREHRAALAIQCASFEPPVASFGTSKSIDPMLSFG